MYYGIFILENCYYYPKLEKPLNISVLRDLNCSLNTSSGLAPNMRIIRAKYQLQARRRLSIVRQVPRPKQVPQRPHLFMTGLNQKVFLSQWGEPETQVALNQLGKLDKLGIMFLIADPAEAAQFSVWIYEKKNSVLLFTKEKLVSHFSCKKFRQSLEERGDTLPIG